MRILLTAIAVIMLGACAQNFVTRNYSEYPYNGGIVTIGMTASEVRSTIGAPRCITKPNNFTPSPADYITQFWHYGYPDKGDRKHIYVILENGVVVAIDEYDYSKSSK